MNLCQHVLHGFHHQVFSSFCSRDIVDLKILQSNWPRAPWSTHGISARIQQIIETFFIEQIQKKLMTFSNKFKKPKFWPIFGPFSPFFEANNFFKKIWLVTGLPLTQAKFPKKLLSQSQENFQTEGRKCKRMDRP